MMANSSSRKSIRFILLLFIIGILISACNGPPPICDENSIPSPIDPFSPGEWGVASANAVVTYSWNYPDTCEPEYFVVQISEDEIFGKDQSDIITLQTSDGGEHSLTAIGLLEPGEDYWWRVIAIVNNNPSLWPTRIPFVAGIPCPGTKDYPPQLLDPNNGAVIADPFPTLSYAGTEDCVYEFLVNLQTDPGFNQVSLIPNQTVATQSIPNAALQDCTTYYWKVRTVADNQISEASEHFTFTTDFNGTCQPQASTCTSISELTWSEPTFPIYNIIVPLTPSFSWNDPSACIPDNYVIRITSSDDFANPDLVQYTMNSNTNWNLFGVLDPATAYAWQVAPVVNNETGLFSAVGNFITGPICEGLNQPVPNLLYPADASIQTSFPVAMGWEVQGSCVPTLYMVDIQDDPNFGGVSLYPYFASFGQNTSMMSPPLNDCAMYYWRIASANGGAMSAYSSTNSFFANVSGNCPLPASLLNCTEVSGVYFPPDVDEMVIHLGSPGIIEGIYAASLNSLPYECTTFESYPDRLFCSGPELKSGTPATLLIMDANQEKFCTLEFVVPVDIPPTPTPTPFVCGVPPAEGCGFNGHWYEPSCSCVQCARGEDFNPDTGTCDP